MGIVIDLLLGVIVAIGGAVGFLAPPLDLRLPLVLLIWFGGMIGRAAWRLREPPRTAGRVLAAAAHGLLVGVVAFVSLFGVIILGIQYSAAHTPGFH